MGNNSDNYYGDLRKKIAENFTMDELFTICLDYNIDHERISTSNQKDVFVRDLIVYFARTNKLKSLVRYCEVSRSHVKWPQGDPPNLFYSTESSVLGSFLLRTVAFVIDHSILLFGSTLVITLVENPDLWFSLFAINSVLEGQNLDNNLFFLILHFFTSWIYFASMESSRWQATFGKRLVGITVIDEAGDKIGFPRATVRFLTKSALWFIYPLGCWSVAFLSALLIIFKDNKQGVHDKIARTFVRKVLS